MRRRSRGIAIGAVSTGLLLGGTAFTAWAESELDERATRKEAFLKVRLPELDPLELLTSADASALIGDYREIKQTPEGGIEVSVEVHAGWMSRCLIAVRPVTAQGVTVRSVDGRCV